MINTFNKDKNKSNNTKKKKTYYYICPYCDAHLDPGEKCTCKNGTINNEAKLVKTLGKDR